MSKTFGQLRAGDEVYVIKGSSVEIAKVTTAEPSPTEMLDCLQKEENTMIEKDLETICQHYGIRKQLKKLSEEVFELQEAVIDNEWDVDGNTDHIAEELADVMVLWEQIRLHYEVPIQVIQGIMKEKIERQLKRINEEKK